MRKLLVLALVLGMVSAAAAIDLGNQAPVKTPGIYPENVVDPTLVGGENIASAVLIPALPYSDSGTTAGHVNDYDYACPYTGSTSPDVVYKFVPTGELQVDIDLCYSSFDTKVYVYQAGVTAPIACNDDFYFAAPCYTYSSFLDNVPMTAPNTYYIVVDGYGGASGAYVMDVTGEIYVPCLLPCPAGGFPEGEPALVPGYVDNYNGGCNSAGYPFQSLTADGSGNLTLCGRAGWVGGGTRDTDWFILTANGTPIEVTADAEWPTYFFELGPQDCASIGVLQIGDAGPCVEAYVTLTGYALNAPVWVWGGAQTYDPPAGAPNEYNYIFWFTGLKPGIIATEATTWGTLKALYE